MRPFDSIRLLPVILLILLACSTAPQNETLLHVDSLIEDNPQLALDIIDSLDSTSPLLSHADSSLRTLLLYEARYKNDLPISGDTVLEVAADYFRESDDDRRLMRLLFVKSQAEFADRDLSASMRTAMDVDKIARNLGDTLFMARTSGLMGQIFQRSYNLNASLEKTVEAARLFRSIGRDSHFRYALVDKARDLHNLGRDTESLALLDSLIPRITSYPDLLGYALETRLFSLIGLDSLSRIKDDYNRLQEIISTGEYSYNPSTALDVALAIRNYTKAYQTLREVSPSPEFISESDIEYGYYKYYKAVGKGDSALNHYEKHMFINQSATMDILNQNVAFARGDWFKNEAQNHQYESSRIRLMFIAASIIGLLIIISLVFMYRFSVYRNRIKISEYMMRVKQLTSAMQSEISDRDSQIVNMRTTIENQNFTIDENQAHIQRLYGKEFEIVNDICKTYMYSEEELTDKDRSRMFKEINAIVTGMGASDNLAKLEERINKYKGDIFKRFREDFKENKELDNLDYKILILTLAGFSTAAICVICSIKDTTLYGRRKQLKALIKQSSSPYIKEYIEALHLSDRPRKPSSTK